MNYWLMLAFVYTAGFAILVFRAAREFRWAFVVGVGLALLAASLGLELILGFDLQDWAARFFYWARVSLALAWLGLGHSMLRWPKNRILSYSLWALGAISLLMLALIAFAPITRAEDWFRPDQPIYSQLDDLIATNRPIRWGALLLNVGGALALAGVPMVDLVKHKQRSIGSVLRAAGLTSAAVLLLVPIYWPISEPNALFITMELLPPVLLFTCVWPFLSSYAAAPSKPGRRRTR